MVVKLFNSLHNSTLLNIKLYGNPLTWQRPGYWGERGKQKHNPDLVQPYFAFDCWFLFIGIEIGFNNS